MKRNAYQGGLAGIWHARVILHREEFPLIREWMSTWDLLTRAMAIHLFFFSAPCLGLILNPARGKQRIQQVFTMHLPSAYFAGRHLVELAKSSGPLDACVEGLLEELSRIDSYAAERLREASALPDSYRDQLTVVLLVYWAFHGAWDKYKVNGLPEPQDAFRQYLYGKKRREIEQIAKASKKYGGMYDKLLNSWKKLYLGERGAAAKAYHLI
jgi:hypothetical protein